MRSRRSQQQNQRRRGSVNSVISEEVADRFMRLPRNTLTARPAHRRARGIDAVLVALDKKVQLGLRQLCFERMEIEARRAAVLMRLDAAGHREGDREPDVLVRLNTQLADNDYNIRWLAKGAAPVLLEALQDPEVRASLALPVASEEDAANGEGGGSPSEEDPRVWRRRLETRKITRLDAPYRRVTHDSPDVRGNRSLTNELNSKRPEDGLSYYQKQTLRYGPARRGSTSIAGAWEDLFNDNNDGTNLAVGGAEEDAAAAAAGAFYPGGGDDYASAPRLIDPLDRLTTTTTMMSSPQAAETLQQRLPVPSPALSNAAKLNAHSGGGSTSMQDSAVNVLLARARALLEAGGDGTPRPAAAAATGVSTPVTLLHSGAATTITSSSVSGAPETTIRSYPAPRTQQTQGASLSPVSQLSPHRFEHPVSSKGIDKWGRDRQQPHQPQQQSLAAEEWGPARPTVSSYGSASYYPQQQAQQQGAAPFGSASAASSRRGSLRSAGGGGGARSLSPSGNHYHDQTGRGGPASVMSGRSGRSAATVPSMLLVSSDDLLPLPRHTASAVPGLRHARGVTALLASFPRKQQHAIRDFVVDVCELLARKEAMEARLAAEAEDAASAGLPPPRAPRILTELYDALDARKKRLVELAGPTGASLVLAAVTQPETREAVGLGGTPEREENYLTGTAAGSSGGSVYGGGGGGGRGGGGEGSPVRGGLLGATGVEFDLSASSASGGQQARHRRQSLSAGGGGLTGKLTAEDEARVWRRRLDAKRVQPVRTARGGVGTAQHDAPTHTGGRDLFNILNTRDPEEGLSYYQKQTLRYGRARRGSTSIAGAWESVFAEADNAQQQQGLEFPTKQQQQQNNNNEDDGQGSNGAYSPLLNRGTAQNDEYLPSPDNSSYNNSATAVMMTGPSLHPAPAPAGTSLAGSSSSAGAGAGGGAAPGTDAGGSRSGSVDYDAFAAEARRLLAHLTA